MICKTVNIHQIVRIYLMLCFNHVITNIGPYTISENILFSEQHKTRIMTSDSQMSNNNFRENIETKIIFYFFVNNITVMRSW